jgi:conjugal transfer mating pair stabilization protein TraN
MIVRCAMLPRIVNRSGLFYLRFLLFLSFLSLLSCLLIYLTFPAAVFATTMQQQFDQTGAQYQDYAKQMVESKKLDKQIVPDKYKRDVTTVPETRYWDNYDGKNHKAIDVDKKKVYEEDTQANAVRDANYNNKHKINPNNPAYKKAVGYQENAEQILRDNGQDMQCVEVAGQSTTQTTTQHCRASNHQYLECYKYPQVNIIDVPYTTQVTYTGQLIPKAFPEASKGYIVPPESGTISYFHVVFDNYGNNIYRCKRNYWGMLSGYRTNSFYANCGGGTAGFGSGFHAHNTAIGVQAGQHLEFELQCERGGGGFLGFAFLGCGSVAAAHRQWTIMMNVTRYKKEANVYWVDNCQNIDPDACVNIEETCVEADGVRHIGGVDVDLPCWRYLKKYKCGYHKINSCQSLEDKCNFASQRCVEQLGNFCLTYEKTYHCVEENAGDKELICGNPNSIQFKQKIERGTTEDFLKAVSGLAGAVEAGKELKDSQDQLQIFKGDVHDCGEAMAGLYDCCDGGGGIIHHCSDQEKALQEAKEKRLATFAGRYCAKKVLGVCILYHQTWCVFNSKISRIIQEQGRRDQLGIGFGSGEHPNCSGMTPEQLQQLDFRRIDFREIYQDIQNRATLPDDQLGQTFEDKFGGGKAMPEVNAALPKVE